MNCAADGLECTTRTDGFGPAVMCNCHFKGSWNENTLSSADIALLSQHVHGGSTHAQFYARSLLFCTVAPLPFFSHAWQSPAYCEGGGGGVSKTVNPTVTQSGLNATSSDLPAYLFLLLRSHCHLKRSYLFSAVFFFFVCQYYERDYMTNAILTLIACLDSK